MERLNFKAATIGYFPFCLHEHLLISSKKIEKEWFASKHLVSSEVTSSKFPSDRAHRLRGFIQIFFVTYKNGTTASLTNEYQLREGAYCYVRWLRIWRFPGITALSETWYKTWNTVLVEVSMTESHGTTQSRCHQVVVKSYGLLRGTRDNVGGHHWGPK